MNNKRSFEIDTTSTTQPTKKHLTNAGHELCVALMKLRGDIKTIEFKALSGAGSLERCKLFYQQLNKIDEAVYTATKEILSKIGEDRFYVHPPMDMITTSIDFDKCFDDVDDVSGLTVSYE